MSQVQKEARVQVEVGARASQVWDLVADVTRIGEWSHECHSARWLDGATGPTPGARFRGRNRAGWARWGRTCEIVAVDPPHQLCWRTVPTLLFPDSTEWRLELEAKPGDRTLITQSFTVERAPWILDRLYAQLIPANRDRQARLVQDLERAGAAAARESTPGGRSR